MVTKANKHVVAFSPLELLQDFLWSPCVLNFCPFSSSCSQQLQRRNVVTVFLMHVLLKKQAVFRRVFCGFAFSSSISINPSNVQHPGVVGGDSIVNSKLTLPSTQQQQQQLPNLSACTMFGLATADNNLLNLGCLTARISTKLVLKYSQKSKF